MAEMSEKLKEAKRLAEFLVAERSTWDTHHKDITDYICPRYGRYADKGDSDPNTGKKRMQKVLDGTAMRSLNIAGAGLYSGLCPHSRPWFHMGFMDPDLMEFGPARLWAEAVEKRMYWVLAKSGFYAATHQNFRELILFANATTWASAHNENVLHWQTRTWGEYFWGVNGWGEIDTVGVTQKMPLCGVAQRWGTAAFSTSDKTRLEKEPYAWTAVTFLVRPRKNYNTERMDNKNMPFEFIAWMEDGQDILFESGFNEKPALTPRWDVVGPSVYGFGLGHDALPDVKMLQELQSKRLKGVALQIDPPVRVPTGYTRRLLTVPGGQNPVPSQSPDAVGALYQVQVDLRGLLECLTDTRNSVRDGFLTPLFLMLSDHPEMTATEALIREQEKLRVLGPVTERLIGEHLTPALELVFNEMNRIGMIPPPPPEIRGQQMKIEHVSVLAKAQEAAGFQGLAQFVTIVTQMAQVDQSVLKKVDSHQVVDEFGKQLGVSPSVVRSDEDVAKLVQAEQAAIDAQRQGEQLAGMAKTAKDLAGAQMEKPSLLTQAMGGLQQGQGAPAPAQTALPPGRGA